MDAPGAEELGRARREREAAELGLGAAEEFDLDRAIERGLGAGKAPSALAKELARASGLSRREVYGRICSRT